MYVYIERDTKPHRSQRDPELESERASETLNAIRASDPERQRGEGERGRQQMSRSRALRPPHPSSAAPPLLRLVRRCIIKPFGRLSFRAALEEPLGKETKDVL